MNSRRTDGSMDLKLALPIYSKPIKVENPRTSLTRRESAALRRLEDKIRMMNSAASGSCPNPNRDDARPVSTPVPENTDSLATPVRTKGRSVTTSTPKKGHSITTRAQARTMDPLSPDSTQVNGRPNPAPCPTSARSIPIPIGSPAPTNPHSILNPAITHSIPTPASNRPNATLRASKLEGNENKPGTHPSSFWEENPGKPGGGPELSSFMNNIRNHWGSGDDMNFEFPTQLNSIPIPRGVVWGNGLSTPPVPIPPRPEFQAFSSTTALRKYDWTPAPENSTPEEDVSSSPLEDIYGVLTCLGLDKGDETPPSSPPPVRSVQKLPTEAMQSAECKDQLFCDAQLAPKGFLDRPGWKELRPSNFRVAVKPSLQVTLEAANFFIESKPGLNFGPEFFNVQVIGPTGTYVLVEVNKDKGCEGWLECVFRPMEPGCHQINVFLGVRGTHAIEGSPMDLEICRNYTFYGDTNIVMANLSNPTVAGNPAIANSSELKLPVLCKIWCLTTAYAPDVIYATTVGGEILQFDFSERVLKLNAIYEMCKGAYGLKGVCKPTAIAYDPVAKLVVVTDSINHRICKFTLGGNLEMYFGSHGDRIGEFYFPSAVAVSPDGNLLAVADSNNQRVQLFTTSGQFITQRMFTARASAVKVNLNVNILGGLIFNRSGDKMYFSDTISQVVHVLNMDMTSQMMFDQTLYGVASSPIGLALDNVGNILVCDAPSNVVRIFNPNGVLIHSIFGTGNDPMQGPEQIAVLQKGYCCVIDNGGRRLRIF